MSNREESIKQLEELLAQAKSSERFTCFAVLDTDETVAVVSTVCGDINRSARLIGLVELAYRRLVGRVDEMLADHEDDA